MYFIITPMFLTYLNCTILYHQLFLKNSNIPLTSPNTSCKKTAAHINGQYVLCSWGMAKGQADGQSPSAAPTLHFPLATGPAFRSQPPKKTNTISPVTLTHLWLCLRVVMRSKLYLPRIVRRGEGCSSNWVPVCSRIFSLHLMSTLDVGRGSWPPSQNPLQRFCYQTILFGKQPLKCPDIYLWTTV